MKCPKCGHPKHQVTDSRSSGDAVRRRRLCQRCHHRFTTTEVIEQRDEQRVLRVARAARGDIHSVMTVLRQLDGLLGGLEGESGESKT